MNIKTQLIEAQIKYVSKFTDLWKPFNSIYRDSNRSIEVERAVEISRNKSWPAVYDVRWSESVRQFFSDPRIPAYVGLEKMCVSAPPPEIQLLVEYNDIRKDMVCVPFLRLYRLLEESIHTPDVVFSWNNKREAYVRELTSAVFLLGDSPIKYRWLWGPWFYSSDLVIGLVKNQFVVSSDFHIFDLVVWCLYKRRCEEIHGENNPHDDPTNAVYKTAYDAFQPYMNQL